MNIESEIILLKAINEHIDDMVNHSLIEVRGTENSKMVIFHDYPQRSLFFIRLVDFLSCTDARGPLPKTIFLKGLADICDNPNFSVNNSEHELKNTVNSFRTWLNEPREIDIWMPSIMTECNLRITRAEAIKMSGDISKHNYLRAIGVAAEFTEILKRSKINIEQTDALLALADFQERFNDDILIYLASHICEFLNNIRYGIRTYLIHEFSRSYTPIENDHFGRYTYKTPESINSKYAIHCYHELLSQFLRKPFMPKFIIDESLRTEY